MILYCATDKQKQIEGKNRKEKKKKEKKSRRK